MTRFIMRYDIINDFIQQRNFKNYLEIGVHDRNANFNKIKCDNKVCVDPDANANADYITTSDQFFEKNTQKFDIVFVDGLHEAHQVYKDIYNSLNVLNPNGIIVCHDCNPLSLKAAGDYEDSKDAMGKYCWNGDCWKAFVKYRFETDYLCYVINIDEGCGIIDTSKVSNVIKNFYSIGEMTYSMLEENRQYLLGLR